MILRNILLPGVVLPAASAALVLVALRGRSAPRAGTAGLALAVGFLTGFVALSGWPRWPPVEATQRLSFLVATLGALAWPIARFRHRAAILAAEITAVALLLPLVLWAVLTHAWSPAEAVLWMAALFALGLASSRALGAGLEAGGTGIKALSVRWAILASIAVALGLSESFRLALLGGALASAVAVVDLLAQRGMAAWSRADALVPATTLSGLLLVGHFYAALDGLVALLLVLALLLTRFSGSRSRILRLSPLVPLAIALGLTLAAFLRPGDDPYDYYSAAPAASGNTVAVAA